MRLKLVFILLVKKESMQADDDERYGGDHEIYAAYCFGGGKQLLVDTVTTTIQLGSFISSNMAIAGSPSNVYSILPLFLLMISLPKSVAP